MPELETELRRMLAERGASVPVEGGVPRRVLERARRRRSARAATGAGLVVLLLLATTTALIRSEREEDASVLVVAPPSGVLAFAGSAASGLCRTDCPPQPPTRLLDLSASPAAELARLPGPLLEESPPVRTPTGVLVLTGTFEQGTLWLLPARVAEPVRLAERVAGFAVAADGLTVGWSEQGPVAGGPGSQSTLVTARLPDATRLHTTLQPGFARVVGFAGDLLLLETGDGAGSAAAVSAPAQGRVVRTQEFRTVAVTDPGRPRAVLHPGDDGRCGTLVDLGPDGAVAPLGDVGCERRRAFSPDGSLLAGATEEQAPDLVVRSTADGREQLRIQVGGNGAVEQLRWVDRDTVLVLTNTGLTRQVERCSLPDRSCTVLSQVEAGLLLLVEER